MASPRISGRRWPAVIVLALAAIAIGALFGSFRNGSAAVAVKPANTSVPTIAGNAQQGETLTAR